MKISIKIIKCLLAVMFLISSCSRDKSEAKKIEDKIDTVLTVNTAAAIGRDVQKTVEITGTLAPWDEVIVSNEITGVVDKIFVDLIYFKRQLHHGIECKPHVSECHNPEKIKQNRKGESRDKRRK